MVCQQRISEAINIEKSLKQIVIFLISLFYFIFLLEKEKREEEKRREERREEKEEEKEEERETFSFINQLTSWQEEIRDNIFE